MHTRKRSASSGSHQPTEIESDIKMRRELETNSQAILKQVSLIWPGELVLPYTSEWTVKIIGT